MQFKQELNLNLCVYDDDKPYDFKISFPMKHMTAKLHQKLIELTNNFILRISGSKDPHPTATAAEAKAISKATKTLQTPVLFSGKSILFLLMLILYLLL